MKVILLVSMETEEIWGHNSSPRQRKILYEKKTQMCDYENLIST